MYENDKSCEDQCVNILELVAALPSLKEKYENVDSVYVLKTAVKTAKNKNTNTLNGMLCNLGDDVCTWS